MVTISLCMIVKNEESVLARCLDSAAGLFDEIIIVDTGSQDKTKAIAAQYTDKIYDFTWIDDFAAARNYAFARGSCDYLCWLDADDVLLKEDKDRFLALKAGLDPAVDVVMMKYNHGRDEHGNPLISYYRERLLKRSCGFKWQEPVHECIQTGGLIINSEIAITHAKLHDEYSPRNLRILEKHVRSAAEVSARSLFYYARELYYHRRYQEAVEYFTRFLNRPDSWLEDMISACRDLSFCYKELADARSRLQALLRSLEYDTPRAEICCEIGYCFQEAGRYDKAAYWFELALTIPKSKESWGFIINDCYDYIPYLELCVCYDKTGKRQQAAEYNLKAEKIKPDSAAVLYNKNYFAENTE